MLGSVRQEIAVAVRLLRKSPVFTLTAALSLAIGIGANTAIFSLVNGLVLKARPGIASPDRLVDVGRVREGSGFDTSSYPNYLDLEQRVTAFSGLAAYRVEPEPMSLRDPTPASAEAERIYVTTVSGNYFEILGTRPAAGRLFGRGEDAAARVRPTVVISHALWDRKYHRDPSIAGRAVILNGVEATIAGVVEPGFRGTNFMGADAWLPVGAHPVFNRRGEEMLSTRRIVWLLLVGRLKDGIGVGAAQAELTAVARQLAAAYPDSNRDMSWRLSPSALVPAPFQAPVFGFLGVLAVIVALVLLIACVNLAGVLLARAANRRREISVRLAIGASRSRLVRQLLVETLLLFALGCAGGVLLGTWLTGLLGALGGALPFPVAIDLSLDTRVLLFAVLVGLIAGVLSGLVPALQAARTDLVSGLKDDPGGLVFRRLRLRGALLVAQVALSCLLFLGAALFARSLQQAGRIDPGFDAANVDVVALDFAMGHHLDQAGVRFGEELIARARRIPGVTDAALTRVIPLTGTGMGLGAVAPVGHDPIREDVGADWNIVTPGYFRTLRIPILEGRGFTDADEADAPPVAIVNQTFARRAWPEGSPIGQRLVRRNPDGHSELRVVGVVRDGKYRTLGEAPRAFIYVPHAQQPAADMSLVVRHAGERSVVPAVRQALRELDPNLPIVSAQRFDDAVAISLVPQRVAANLAGALGLVGLLLAAIGIYGVTAFSVAQRTREIGVRVALGAAAPQVMRLVLRQGLMLAAAGIVVGLALGAVAARLLSSFLYGFGANDPIAFTGVALVLFATAALASGLPARAAARIDPLKALRME